MLKDFQFVDYERTRMMNNYSRNLSCASNYISTVSWTGDNMPKSTQHKLLLQQNINHIW